MAKRRMLSIDFCESDTFYMLSPTARMLYVHFILNADDDGFVDKWRTVLRCSRIERRHYVTLRDEGYVIELNERLIVITDWHRHNTIRADRYIATVYSKELQGLALDENKRYYKAKEEILVATCVPQSRIDKNREDKIRTDEIREEEKKKDITTNKSYIHTTPASQEANKDVYSSSVDDLTVAALKNSVRLYFMRHYQTTDTYGFIEHCDKNNWISDDGRIIDATNYRKYIERWLEDKL
jgi:hypothetical protein